jgi:2-keto-4-pentenoate hydratase/2-oxohepta-3-ene-1,7-dioic acid hydratase in catechol pathway
MRLVTYDSGGIPSVGLLEQGTVYDVGFDGDMVAFIEAGAPIARRTPVESPVLLAPLRPRSLRDFLAFEGHLRNVMPALGREIPEQWYTTPAYYKGMPDTVIGPEAEIPWPAYTTRLDHELEFAAVIGRKGKDIPKGKALDYIFGYTIWNDMSARDTQALELPLSMGPAKAKDWDGSNVLGPCIVTADEIDPDHLLMTVRVNGDIWGTDTSAHMHHTFADMISYASQSQTIYPGEVFGSGTAQSGSGIEVDRWLKEGDMIEMEVEGIGILRNRVGPKEA